jgi:hypothetical protein
MRPHHRVAARDYTEDQFVDERILRTAQRREIEPRCGKELARIDVPAVRGIEDNGSAPLGRLVDLERRVEFVLGLHGRSRCDRKRRMIAAFTIPPNALLSMADARSATEFNGLHPLFTEEPPNAGTDSDEAQTAVAGCPVSQICRRFSSPKTTATCVASWRKRCRTLVIR